MKKILSIVALALVLGAGIIGCSSSSTSGGGATGSPSSAKSPASGASK